MLGSFPKSIRETIYYSPLVLEVGRTEMEIELNSHDVKFINLINLLQIALSKELICKFLFLIYLADIDSLPPISEELIKKVMLEFR